MDIKVVKFGGSSLASADQFRKVAAIIRSQPERRYVVASAPGKRFSEDIKVTDMLYQCYKLAKRNLPYDEAFSKIEDRYNSIISELGLDFSLEQEYAYIRVALPHAGEDFVASRGEYLNSMILAKYLGFAFIDAAQGIFFNDDGSFDSNRTYETLSQLLDGVDYAVIPGFYGSMPNGTVRTFSRGGSDITGAIVARAVNAAIYENWTDVSGMLMADPRIIQNPKVIEQITYRELRELAYMGATVMHEEAVFPVREARIPINIRNTNAPADPGTMIVPVATTVDLDTVITGVAGKKGFASITIEKDKMNSELGFGRKVLSVLERMNINFEHIPSGIDTMSVVVSAASLEGREEDLIARIRRDTNADSVTIETGIALVSVVGRGMVKAKGTAGRIFTAIAKQDINVKMIDQFSGEKTIILGVDECNYEATLQAIYSEFVREEA